MGHTLPWTQLMGARKIVSFKNYSRYKYINKFQESTICIIDGKVIHLFKVTTLQLKKHQWDIKLAIAGNIFIKNQLGIW